MIEDKKNFLNIIENLKLQLIKFEENESIKIKEYLNNYIMEKNKYYLVIIIIYNKYIFSTNNRI